MGGGGGSMPQVRCSDVRCLSSIPCLSARAPGFLRRFRREGSLSKKLLVSSTRIPISIIHLYVAPVTGNYKEENSSS